MIHELEDDETTGYVRRLLELVVSALCVMVQLCSYLDEHVCNTPLLGGEFREVIQNSVDLPRLKCCRRYLRGQRRRRQRRR
jgi:hypothetical protein